MLCKSTNNQLKFSFCHKNIEKKITQIFRKCCFTFKKCCVGWRLNPLHKSDLKTLISTHRPGVKDDGSQVLMCIWLFLRGENTNQAKPAAKLEEHVKGCKRLQIEG